MNIGCGCLAMFVGPRVVLFFAWIFGALGPSFETAIWPFLGFLFLPWTTLCYATASHHCGYGNDFSIGWTLLMVVAVIIDLSSNSNEAKAKKEAKKHV